MNWKALCKSFAVVFGFIAAVGVIIALAIFSPWAIVVLIVLVAVVAVYILEDSEMKILKYIKQDRQESHVEATICPSESIRKAAKAYSERASNGHHFSELDGLFKAFRAGAVWQGKRVASYIRECLAPVQQCVDKWDASSSPRSSSYHYDRGKIQGYKDILRDLESGGLDEYMDEKMIGVISPDDLRGAPVSVSDKANEFKK